MTIRDWKWAAIVGWLVVIGLVVVGINTPPATVVVSETVPAGYIPACEHEDDNNCYWDADSGLQGNGFGTDSVVIVP